MIPYGKVKTRNPGKNSSHRDCPICDPAEGNKKKARQDGKKEVSNSLIDRDWGDIEDDLLPPGLWEETQVKINNQSQEDRMINIIKSLYNHSIWFNRKSQHYMLGNWACYVWDPFVLAKYYFKYPKAYVKFIWLSRYDILKRTIIR